MKDIWGGTINILFVCTGNTCRSPMAACMMNAMLQEAGLTRYTAASAGISATDGQPASRGAINAMAAKGLDLSGHRSRLLTESLLDNYQLIFCVSQRHADVLQNHFAPPQPMNCFFPAIPDPFGGSDAEYAACATAMEMQLKALVKNFASIEAHENEMIHMLKE